MYKIINVALNDLTLNFRSFFAIGMMFVAPLLITGLIFFAFGGGGSSPSIQPIRVAVTNLDAPINGKTSLAQSLVDIMDDSSVSNWLKATETPDAAAARQMVNKQEAGAAIIIPPDFSKTINHGRNPAPIQIIQDPTLTIGPAVVQNLVEMYLDSINGFRMLVQMVTDHISLAQKPVGENTYLDAVDDYKQWYKDYQDTLFHTNQNLDIIAPAAKLKDTSPSSSNGMGRLMGIVLAGQMLFFAFYTGAYSMMSILREQEQGTLARLFTTPTDRMTILTGKFLAVFLMVLVQSLVMLTIGALAFGIQWGQPGSVLLMVVGQVIAAGGLGVLLISFVKTSKQAGPVLGAGLTMLGMLGGLFTSNVQMPEAFTRLQLFTPQGWAISGWKLAMNDLPPADILLTFLVLACLGSGMFFAGSFLFRRRFAS
jgi:ABC-2 type transport system permease protein